MNFRKINIVLIALIIVTIGAVFFIRQYNKRFAEKKPIREEKIIKVPEAQVSLEKEVTDLLESLKKQKVIDIEGNEIKVFDKHFEDWLKEEIERAKYTFSFEIKDEKVVFSKGKEEVSYLYRFVKPRKEAKLIIVIDDIGNSLEMGERVLRLPNITLSIIPELKYSLFFAEKARKQKKDVLVHVPMEPHNFEKYNNENTKFLKVEMDDREITELGEQLVNSVPYAIGANNHMGSKFTENEEKMAVFLKTLKRKGMFFLDSKTSPFSVAKNVAEQIKIPSITRDVFLDHEIDEEKISQQLDRAVAIAKEKGYAIAIGHPHKETLNVLERRLKEIEKDVKVVPISKLIKDRG
jgi:polysaccharide deacetylase 2 family uncharacterized protein YibQ